jgi:hypothetical protein
MASMGPAAIARISENPERLASITGRLVCLWVRSLVMVTGYSLWVTGYRFGFSMLLDRLPGGSFTLVHFQ